MRTLRSSVVKRQSKAASLITFVLVMLAATFSGNNLIAQSAVFNGNLQVLNLSPQPDTPTGVAIDSSGNIYIADNGSESIVKETPLPDGSGYTRSTVTFGVHAISPNGIAVDAGGNVYYTAAAPNYVVKATPSGSSYTLTNIGSGWVTPFAIAVDPEGNVYVTDTGTPGVYKLMPNGSGYTQTAIGSGMDEPGSHFT